MAKNLANTHVRFVHFIACKCYFFKNQKNLKRAINKKN